MKKLDMKWLVVVTFVIAGTLCGAAIGSYMVTMNETLGEDISVWNELMKFLELILLMYIVYMVNVIIHEGGHLIFGLMTGYKFNSFRIFSVIFIKQNGKLKIKNISLAGTGGQCLMSPPELIDGKMPYVLYNLGGVILNVITSLIFIVIYLISLWKLLSLAMIMSAIMGFASALVNGIPMKVGDINNDGYNAVQLGRDKDALKALWVQLKMNGALAEGIGIREMPEEWFESIDGKNDNPMITSIKVFYCNRLMEMHKFEQTKEEIKKVLESNMVLVGVYRYLLICDYIYCELIDGNIIEAEEFYTKDLQKFMKSMKKFPAILRTKYTYELLHNKDSKQAEKLRTLFNIMSEKYPYTSDIEAENELMDIAKSIYDGVMDNKINKK
ncbi:site-2 protease family protein [Eubacterium ventriosum]|uniref:site-2 protease family protein n=1 Tax=Eubacterium ventriosum TaxID=39496 RepID=UPI00267254E4|nr:site-2 protease family protein [Eubacterium ventriosum]